MREAASDRSVVLINVFTVAPERQADLVDILTAATDGSVDREPGFLSATLHRSLDGTKVTMVARWKDPESYAAMRQKPGRPFLDQALAIATFEPGMYEAVRTFLPAAVEREPQGSRPSPANPAIRPSAAS